MSSHSEVGTVIQMDTKVTPTEQRDECNNFTTKEEDHEQIIGLTKMGTTIAITTNKQSKQPYDPEKHGDKNYKNNADILDNDIGRNNKNPEVG